VAQVVGRQEDGEGQRRENEVDEENFDLGSILRIAITLPEKYLRTHFYQELWIKFLPK
jgi:hypothetical protein